MSETDSQPIAGETLCAAVGDAVATMSDACQALSARAGGGPPALDSLLARLAQVTEPAAVADLEVAARGRRWGTAATLAAELDRREAARGREVDAVVAAVLGGTG